LRKLGTVGGGQADTRRADTLVTASGAIERREQGYNAAMQLMDFTMLMVILAAVMLVGVAVIALQQAEHRRTGLLPGPDPRLSTGSLLDAVLGAVPIRLVRQGSVAFEDGSGLLLSDPDRESMDVLSRLSGACDVVLERVYELTQGWRLVFRGGTTQAYVDVSAWQLVAPTTLD
jgi:hypothetical protein